MSRHFTVTDFRKKKKKVVFQTVDNWSLKQWRFMLDHLRPCQPLRVILNRLETEGTLESVYKKFPHFKTLIEPLKSEHMSVQDRMNRRAFYLKRRLGREVYHQ